MVRERLPAAYLKIVRHLVLEDYFTWLSSAGYEAILQPVTLTCEGAAARSCAFKIESQDFEILLEGSLAAHRARTETHFRTHTQPLVEPARNWHRAHWPASASFVL